MLVTNCESAIFKSDRLTSYFLHYFITYFTTSRPENFFNSNFEITLTYSFDTEKLKDVQAMPVTASNLSMTSTSLVDIADPLIIAESLLFLFATEDKTFNSIFSELSNDMHSMYDTMVSNPESFAIDPMLIDKSNINKPNVYDFSLMVMITRYMGRFFPAIFNSVSCMSDFVPATSGEQTNELYTTDYT